MGDSNKRFTKGITLSINELASLNYASTLTLKTIKQLLNSQAVEQSTKDILCEISTGLVTALKKLR